MNYSLVDKIAVIVSALGAIVVGMMFFSIDVFALSFFVTHLSFLIKPLEVIFGLAGVYSLISVFTCSSCDSKK